MRGDAPLILLVDDDRDFLELNRDVLERNGYKVLCTSAPQEALEKMALVRPALVVTDLIMNGLDTGFSFSRQLKQDPAFKDIPVIIVTAVGSEHGFDFRPRTPQDLTAICADAYLEKPIPPEKLLEAVNGLLKRYSKEATG